MFAQDRTHHVRGRTLALSMHFFLKDRTHPVRGRTLYS